MISAYKNLSAKSSSFFEWLNRNALIAALIIITSHLFIKSIDLGESGFWYDEAYSVYHSQKAVNEIIDNAKFDHNPPFYNLFLKVWMMIFGISETAVRYLSVVFSSLTGVAIFYFCKRHFNIQTAFFASVIFLASNVHVYYAHEARSYALTSLLSVLSFYFCLELLKRPNYIKAIILGAINAAILYTHFLTSFLFVAEFIVALLFINQSRKGFIFYFFSQILAIIFFLPWVPALINMVKQTNKGFWLGHPSWQDLVSVFHEFAMGKDLLILYCALIAAIIFSLIIVKRKQIGINEWRNILILMLWGFLPVFIDYFIAAITPVFLLRYVLYASIGLIILVAYLISLTPVNSFFKIVFIIPLAILLFQRIDYAPEKNQDFKRIMPLVKSEKDSNTLVVLSSVDLFFIYSYYYNKDFFTDYHNTITSLTKDNIVMMNDSSRAKKMDFSFYPEILLVQSFEGYADPQGTLFKYLENNFELQEVTKKFAGITYAVFKNKNYDPSGYKKRQIYEFSDAELVPLDSVNNKNWKNLQTLTKEKAIHGNYSSKISKENPYSIELVKEFDSFHLGLTSIFKLSCQIYPSATDDGAELIINFFNSKNELLGWNSRNIKTMRINPREWNKIEFNCLYPVNLDSVAYVKALVQHSNGDGPVYIDDFKLTISE